jgi:hypothetical protein
MDQAIELGLQHVGDGARIVQSGSGNFQFISEYTTPAGHRITLIARFDINPASPHVRSSGPHLNLETQVNGVTVTTGHLADPHIPIIPGSWRPTDIP